jgi:hypothetical protein
VTLLDKIPNTSHGIQAGIQAGTFAAMETHLPGITNPTREVFVAELG